MVAPDLLPVRHKAGAWNLRIGRNPVKVTGEVLSLLLGNDLDWLTVCEANGYIAALRGRLAEHGYVVLTNEVDGSARDSAVIVRRRLALSGLVELHRLGGVEWERKPGRPGLHWARSMSSVVLDDSLARVGAVHLPPGPFGPRFPLRRRAFRVAVRRLRQIGRRWNQRRRNGRPLPWLLPGDWNMRREQAGSWLSPSPRWLADQLGAEITGNGIDYVMHRGCQVSNLRRVDHGTSDHLPLVFDVTYPEA